MKSADIKNLAQALLEMTDDKAEDANIKSAKDFAKYLQKNNLLKDSDKIIKEYQILYNKKHSIVEATVYLLNRLPEKTKTSLREALKKKYNAKEVHILEKVDERILGGMKIRVGDEIFDSTVKNSLNQLELKLLKS